jgi:hypothetical protein
MVELFREETKSFVAALYACKSNKGNLYYKVYKSYKKTYHTEESSVFHTIEEALLTYISLCE